MDFRDWVLINNSYKLGLKPSDGFQCQKNEWLFTVSENWVTAYYARRTKWWFTLSDGLKYNNLSSRKLIDSLPWQSLNNARKLSDVELSNGSQCQETKWLFTVTGNWVIVYSSGMVYNARKLSDGLLWQGTLVTVYDAKKLGDGFQWQGT